MWEIGAPTNLENFTQGINLWLSAFYYTVTIQSGEFGDYQSHTSKIS